MLVLVGDHATWHRASDPPLNMDIEAVAGTVSHKILTVQSTAVAPSVMAQAIATASEPKPPGESGIVTVLLPHDLSWKPTAASEENRARSTLAEFPQLPCTRSTADYSTNKPAISGSTQLLVPGSTAMKAFIRDCAAALKACKPGKLAIYLGGQALTEEGKLIRSKAAGQESSCLDSM
jgi:acetolactate synthase-1/2/3 large subunit